jgi:hypothetical protein
MSRLLPDTIQNSTRDKETGAGSEDQLEEETFWRDSIQRGVNSTRVAKRSEFEERESRHRSWVASRVWWLFTNSSTT